MAWLAVDKDGIEWIFENEPSREPYCDDGVQGDSVWIDLNDWAIPLPKGSIYKLIGRELTWNDEPIELK